MRIETVIFDRAVQCDRCYTLIIGTANRIHLATGARVYCHPCAEKGMANLERFLGKLELPEAEFEAWLREETA